MWWRPESNNKKWVLEAHCLYLSLTAVTHISTFGAHYIFKNDIEKFPLFIRPSTYNMWNFKWRVLWGPQNLVLGRRNLPLRHCHMSSIIWSNATNLQQIYIKSLLLINEAIQNSSIPYQKIGRGVDCKTIFINRQFFITSFLDGIDCETICRERNNVIQNKISFKIK